MLELQKLINKIKENQRLLIGLISGLFIFLTLIFGIAYNLKRESEISQWVLNSQEEIYHLEKIVSLMKDYETGSRGFLLTNQEAYAKPLNEAAKSLDAVLLKLEHMAQKNDVQQKNLDSLTFYLKKKADFSFRIIQIKRQQGHEAAIAIFNTDIGKKYMDKIRQIADTMHIHAKAQLAQRKKESETAAQATNQALILGVIVFGLLLLYAIWKSWQQENEKRASELELRTEKAFSEALLKASPDGMIGFNRNGEIVLFNNRAEDLFGYSQKDILGAPIVNLLPTEEHATLASFQQDFRNSKSWTLARDNSKEMLILKHDGTKFPAEVRLNFVNSDKGEMLIANIRDITLRKEAELQLIESEKNLQAILSSSQEAIYLLDVNYRLVLLNEHSRIIIQQAYNVSCKPGDHFPDLFDDEFKAKLETLYTQVLSGQKIDIERTFLLADGEAHYISTYFPVKGNDGIIIGICCASKNITQRKQSEEAAKNANAEKEEYQSRFKAILDYSPQAVLIKDIKGNHIFSNTAFSDLLALKGEQELTESLRAVIDDAPLLTEFLASYEGDGLSTLSSKEWQQQVILHNGRVLEMEIVKFPLYDRQKQLFGICTLFKDISEQIKHQKQLIEARENAEQAERLQEQFLANMSHELRTPMNGIIGMVNLLLTSSSLQPDQKGRLQVIRHSSDTLLNLINDILDLSKIKAGMLTIDKVNFDFNDTIASTAMIFREKACEKGIKLAVSADPFIPRFLTGDPHRLNQILNNLLSNAVKFTAKGQVRLEASLLSKENEQVIVEFVVSDSGIGIDEGKLDYIFDNFTQESTDISSKYGGTGLGLAITKRLIELQNGEIAVESVKDKGTTFTFTIPYTVASDTTNLPVSTSYITPQETLRKNYSGKRALIVEDNDINQAVLSSSLKQYKLDVVVVNNGQEAVDLLQTGESFDIIFMDLRMPVMNGFQATAYIKQNLQLQTPIVVLTASVLRNERERCLEIGASDYMAKPFAMADLSRALGQFISESENTSGQEAFSPTAYIPVTAPRAFDASRLLELNNPVYIRRILDLFQANLPTYLLDLQTLAANNQKLEFLEKAHKLKGSFSAIQIDELYNHIVTMEEEAPEQEHLHVFEQQLAHCAALCATLMPTIVSEVETAITLLEASA